MSHVSPIFGEDVAVIISSNASQVQMTTSRLFISADAERLLLYAFRTLFATAICLLGTSMWTHCNLRGYGGGFSAPQPDFNENEAHQMTYAVPACRVRALYAPGRRRASLGEPREEETCSNS